MTGLQSVSIAEWQVASTAPGVVEGPAGLEAAHLAWVTASAPTTAAAALRAAGAFSLEGPARRFDGEDWWFRARLPQISVEPGDELALCLDGLATVADVWLDGAPLLSSDSMFRRHRRILDGETRDRELVIRCRALDPLLAARRPRPRWRAPMIEHQQLRWFRTTLLGRTPGWSPPAPAVGPWRPVRLERSRGHALDETRLRVTLRDRVGVVEARCRLRALGGARLPEVALLVEREGVAHRVVLTDEGGVHVGRLEIPDVARWWPHTHGEPSCYEAHLAVGAGPALPLGPIGFREITREGEFALRVNGVLVFCRGAVWTPLDPLTLVADRAATHAALQQARDAGMNMLRVGGTMVYESDDFHDLCARLGILVWQDLMFANMDYPEDEAFLAAAVEEVTAELSRLAAGPSLAVICGNSEVEQQAAMWGAPRERWSPRLFHEVLAGVARERCPDVPYWPSSAHGGAFPHQADAGTTSYYGVGAYLRPLDDARRAEVRFASECLAFANVPEPRALPGGPSVRVHHPQWKARTPRDLGAGWDFDDVRDHYVERLFRVDALALRYADHERYLALGRVATGEVMAQVFGEWRRQRSTCGGGLVWFLRDLWPSAGWGLVDAGGTPKAAWHILRRALAPVAAHLSDEGGNGLTLHLGNDTPAPALGELEVTLYRAGEIQVATTRRPVEIAAHAALELPVARCFDHFLDLSFAYRFGPPSQDLVVATLRAPSGATLAQAFHFPLGLPAARELDVGLTAEAHLDDSGALQLQLRTRRFAQSIAVDVEGFIPEDAYFHLPPGGERTLRLRRTTATASPPSSVPRGTLQPLNAEATTKLLVVTS